MEIPSIIHESWHEYLRPLFQDPKMEKIRTEILPKYKFYPAGPDIFRVFSMPLNKIKVVILGQDPYPNGEAIGLAFAVKSSVKSPPSLDIIHKEVRRTQGVMEIMRMSNQQWQTLQHWEEQGVFLLNTALTVRAKDPDSHTGIWQWFIKVVIQTISAQVSPIWLLWGSKAQAYESIIRNAEIFKINHILKAPHPAAELHKNSFSSAKFTGCNHFNLCNEVLREGQEPIINW